MQAFLLPSDDARIHRARLDLSRRDTDLGGRSNDTPWEKCESRHQAPPHSRASCVPSSRRGLRGWERQLLPGLVSLHCFGCLGVTLRSMESSPRAVAHACRRTLSRDGVWARSACARRSCSGRSGRSRAGRPAALRPSSCPTSHGRIGRERRWAFGVGLDGVVSQGVPTVNSHAPARGRNLTAALIVLPMLPAQTERVLDSMDIDYMRMVAEAR